MRRAAGSLRWTLVSLALATVVAWASTPAVAADTPADAWSFARPLEARVTDVALDLMADFRAQRLAGTARLTIERAAGAHEIVLDALGLDVASVTDGTGQSLAWSFGDERPVRGRPLLVALPAGREIVIHYRTTPGAVALQWLAPEQTAGKRHPYLFTQGEAILTRSWVPTQDSPGIRQTYSARIVVPRSLVAVMSAESLTPGGVETPDGRAFSFRMNQPIPPYLFALAVGDLAFVQIGARTGVWAEPSVVQAAAWEFADVEKMVGAAEALYGPYRWGRYDILVLPPSFPYGGMENPRLTFMSPTAVAGDRSLTSIAAHELAHSWSGNLVTNATWRDFWLNEGVTTYIEERIVERLYGRDTSAAVQAVTREDLVRGIASLPPARTVLYLPDSENPNDATDVPYGKGAAFLRLIELSVGRERFDGWLRAYFDRHAFTSVTTDTFLDDLRRSLFGADADALEARLRVREWLFEPGLPANAPVPMSEGLDRARGEAARFANGASASSLVVTAWTTQQWLQFLARLPRTVARARLEDLDRTFALSERQNAVVLAAWLRIALEQQYEPALPATERFLTTQGRMKFLEPLYRALLDSEWGQPIARRIYAIARPLYHPAAQAIIDPLFDKAPQP